MLISATQTQEMSLSNIQRSSYSAEHSRLAFEYTFCLFGEPGAEGTNYGTRGTCRLANKDKQVYLGWTGNILNALVFPSLSVAEWRLLSCSPLLFSSCQWTNCRLCPLRGQNPSCSNNCDVRACFLLHAFLVSDWYLHWTGEMVFLYQVQYIYLVVLGICQFWLNKGLVGHAYPHEIST